MASSFREYLQAEMSAIRASVGHEEHQDPETFTQRAIDWIENNAHRFRSEWERNNRAIDCGSGTIVRSIRSAVIA